MSKIKSAVRKAAYIFIGTFMAANLAVKVLMVVATIAAIALLSVILRPLLAAALNVASNVFGLWLGWKLISHLKRSRSTYEQRFGSRKEDRRDKR